MTQASLSGALFAEARPALLRTLATKSFRLGEFTLASGQKSDYYIDCRTTTLDADGGRLAGLVLYALMRQHLGDIAAVGGLTMGADPLVSNVASVGPWLRALAGIGAADGDADAPMYQGFLVRKTEKTHGAGRKVEGFLAPGAKVAIVDDVCTTGGSTLTAMAAARDAGMDVAGVLCLVDREQGGREAIEAAAAPAPFLRVFTANDIRESHRLLHTKRSQNG